ncbi:hypothetical protein BOA8489_02892 [Boseongicola aestuarii]|uniref:Uncharacterized protein n=1 Tax=Boseongicola aestuarii TaxID=1470561 RepID=A0A238J4D5_9RHOB|nr:hypothetical protein BOA8489_02892 [Boseongicola aestuarii]
MEVKAMLDHHLSHAVFPPNNACLIFREVGARTYPQAKQAVPIGIKGQGVPQSGLSLEAKQKMALNPF